MKLNVKNKIILSERNKNHGKSKSLFYKRDYTRKFSENL